jgi:hypothetical protein
MTTDMTINLVSELKEDSEEEGRRGKKRFTQKL